MGPWVMINAGWYETHQAYLKRAEHYILTAPVNVEMNEV